MKAFVLAIAVLALVIAAYLSPALAQTAKPSGGNNSPFTRAMSGPWLGLAA